MHIKSAGQLRKLALFPFNSQLAFTFVTQEWFHAWVIVRITKLTMVLSKVNVSCELNGKKSKFTQLRGGLNVHQILRNFDTCSKTTRTYSPLIQIRF